MVTLPGYKVYPFSFVPGTRHSRRKRGRRPRGCPSGSCVLKTNWIFVRFHVRFGAAQGFFIDYKWGVEIFQVLSKINIFPSTKGRKKTVFVEFFLYQTK